MIEEKGDLEFSEADDANIPVDVWLTETEDEKTGEKDGTWTLSAANYMPRFEMVSGGVYEAVSSSRDELVGIVKKHILPLYETAVEKLKAICEGTAENLYYWKRD